MRLRKSQKEAVLRWIAEGLLSDEINKRAADYVPPFSVSRAQVDYYRHTRDIEIDALTRAGEQDALVEGLALKSERVRRLKQLAMLMEKDLFNGFLWTEQIKSIGPKDASQIVEYEEFNAAEVSAYRGVLDDIAREVGGRAIKQEVSGPDGGNIAAKVTVVFEEAENWRGGSNDSAAKRDGDPVSDTQAP
jgi:hypothetical protein